MRLGYTATGTNMDFSLILFLIIVVIFGFTGYRSGFLIVLSRLISLPAAYVVALLFTRDFGQWLQGVSPLEGLISYVVGGAILFIGTSSIISILFSIIRRTFIEPNATASQISSIGGGLLSAGIGVFVGLLAVWFSSTMQALIHAKKGDAPKPPTAFERKVKDLAGSAVGGLSSTLSDDETLSEATAVLIANPAENIERVNRISQSGNLQALLNNRSARQALDARNPAALLRNHTFQNLVNNPDFVELAKEMKLASNSEELGKEVAMKFTRIWAQIDQVKNDERFVNITQDPEIRNMMSSGNIYKMVNSAKIEELLNVISSVEAPEITFEEHGNMPKIEEGAKVYRWVDEDGNVHYSDKKHKE